MHLDFQSFHSLLRSPLSCSCLLTDRVLLPLVKWLTMLFLLLRVHPHRAIIHLPLLCKCWLIAGGHIVSLHLLDDCLLRHDILRGKFWVVVLRCPLPFLLMPFRSGEKLQLVTMRAGRPVPLLVLLDMLHPWVVIESRITSLTQNLLLRTKLDVRLLFTQQSFRLKRLDWLVDWRCRAVGAIWRTWRVLSALVLVLLKKSVSVSCKNLPCVHVRLLTYLNSGSFWLTFGYVERKFKVLDFNYKVNLTFKLLWLTPA